MIYPYVDWVAPEMVDGGVATFVFQPNAAFVVFPGIVKYVPAGTFVVPTVDANIAVPVNPAEL